MLTVLGVFFFQAEDGIRDLVRSRGLGDVYKRQRDGLTAQAAKESLWMLSGLEPFQLAARRQWSLDALSLIHI